MSRTMAVPVRPLRRPGRPSQRPWAGSSASLLITLAVAVPPLASQEPAGPGEARLRVLATHDFHGALRPRAYPWSRGGLVGGIATLKSLMDSAEAQCDCPTVRLDGGDQMQGTLESNLTRGASTVLGFNLLGLDAAAIGNHELDWGVDTLTVREAEAMYAWLGANVFEKGTDRRPRWARPWALLEEGGVRTGVIGYMTAGTPATLRVATTAPYEFRRGLEGIRSALAELGPLRRFHDRGRPRGRAV